MSTENYEHELYKHQQEVKDSDAVAYAWVNKQKAVFFPYKQPEILPTEIRANVLYAGLCHSDCLHVRGLWGDIAYPVAPGHEIIAEVTEVGSEVKDFKKGEKVGFGVFRAACGKCKFCVKNKECLCQDVAEEKETYGLHFGGYSTQIQQPADFFFKLPANLDLRRSAPLLCAGVTVYSPIKEYAKQGMKTAVIGVGGLGHMAVQILAKLGYDVTGVTNSLDKTDLIKGFGASKVINGSDPETFKKHAREFDFIINTLPVSDGFENYIELCAVGGYFAQVGLPDVDTKVSFSINSLVANEIHLVGALVGSRKDINEMLQLCADKNIYPLCEEFVFEDFSKAFDKLENGRPKFRCVVDCAEYSKKQGLFK